MKNKQVDSYIEELAPDAKKTAADLRSMICDQAPDAQEEFKWSRPCYKLEKAFCSFLVCKEHISLAFEQGTQLDDPHSLLEGNGKLMRHTKIPLAGPTPLGVKELIKQAANL